MENILKIFGSYKIINIQLIIEGKKKHHTFYITATFFIINVLNVDIRYISII